MIEPEGEQPLAFADTNLILRYLIQDRPEVADDIQRIVHECPELWITGVVIAETAYVLTSVYRVPREHAIDTLIDLLNRHNVRVHGSDKGLTIAALTLCRRSGRVSFADALLWAAARSSGPDSRIYSLDGRFPSTGAELRDRL